MAPHREPRPDAKPPFGGLALADLTTMLHGPWKEMLRVSGYHLSEPKKYNQILGGLEVGVDIGYKGSRTKARDGPNHGSATKIDAVCAKVTHIITANAAAGKTAGPFAEKPFSPFSVSPIGAVPKKPDEGKTALVTDIRVIHDLSYPFGGDSINKWSEDVPLSLSGFDKAVAIVTRLGPGCYLTKLDVKAAYKLVPVRFEDWNLLGFRWLNQYYYERTLPFGLKSSCRQWEWYATALNHFFVWMGAHDTIHYVDDFLLAHTDLEEAREHLTMALAICVRLGIPIADEKTVGPAQILTFLGVELDTLRMTARLPLAKLRELTALLSVIWSGKVVATRTELQSLCGKLNWAAQVVRPGRTYLRRIIDHMKTAYPRFRHGTTSKAKELPKGVLADIRWWREHINISNGVSLLYDREWTTDRTIELTTDACNSGWGAAFGDRWIKGTWTEAEHTASRGTDPKAATKRSMPYLELLAILYAAATWGDQWARKRLVFHCDASAVVYAINKGTSHSPAMMTLIRALHALSTLHNFEVRCTHIAGVANVAADALSRDAMQEYFRVRPTGNPTADVIGRLPLLF